jgi:branched-chain amino acid transport system ATP-binding protein
VISSTDKGLLEVDGVSISYGVKRALSEVSLTLRKGQALAVLGANGAGKSSLAGAIAGVVDCTSGRIIFDEKDITHVPAYKRSRLGIVFLPEGRAVFPRLTVRDNLRMFQGGGKHHLTRHAAGTIFEMFPVLGTRQHQLAGTLSGGEQQMLALARAFIDPPKILIADEPTLGLAPQLVEAIFNGLVLARDRGVTVLLIEQYVHRALDFADECLILRRGIPVWRGSTADAKEQVLLSYLGESEFIGVPEATID